MKETQNIGSYLLRFMSSLKTVLKFLFQSAASHWQVICLFTFTIIIGMNGIPVVDTLLLSNAAWSNTGWVTSPRWACPHTRHAKVSSVDHSFIHSNTKRIVLSLIISCGDVAIDQPLNNAPSHMTITLIGGVVSQTRPFKTCFILSFSILFVFWFRKDRALSFILEKMIKTLPPGSNKTCELRRIWNSRDSLVTPVLSQADPVRTAHQ